MKESYEGFAFFCGAIIGGIVVGFFTHIITYGLWLEKVQEACYGEKPLVYEYGGTAFQAKCDIVNQIILEPRK